MSLRAGRRECQHPNGCGEAPERVVLAVREEAQSGSPKKELKRRDTERTEKRGPNKCTGLKTGQYNGG